MPNAIIREHINYRGELSQLNSFTREDNPMRPVVVLINNSPACLVLANWFLSTHDVLHAYAEHTGADIRSLSAHVFGTNVLQCHESL